MANYLLRRQASRTDTDGETRGGAIPQPTGALSSALFEGALRAAARPSYRGVLQLALNHPPGAFVTGFFSASWLASFLLVPMLGPKIFFPRSRFGADPDARSPAGRKRASRTVPTCSAGSRTPSVESFLPAEFGHAGRQRRHAPSAVINLSYNKHRHRGLAGRRYPDLAEARSTVRLPNNVRRLREEAAPAASRESPFSFLPADIVSQILNFGAPAPIDLQVPRTPICLRISNTRTSCCAVSALVPGIVRCAYPGVSGQPRLQRRRGSGRARQYVGLTEARRHETACW